MKNALKEVTYLTIKDLKRQDIVLPGNYSTTFEKIAKHFDLDLNNENILLKDLHYDANHVDIIVKKTSNSLDTIHSSTEKAQVAIQNNDSETLATINNELKDMQKQINFLQKELFSDALTTAYNRKWFMDYFLNDEKFQESGYMAFLDLNKFKIINDSYGHIVGDQVLKYLVKFLKSELAIKGIDVVRYAGDEFLVLFSKEATKGMDVKKRMDEVQHKLSQQVLKSAKIDSLKFSFSYGLVKYKKYDQLEKLLSEADELMYKNKEENR